MKSNFWKGAAITLGVAFGLLVAGVATQAGRKVLGLADKELEKSEEA